jgi:hypothetical protein
VQLLFVSDALLEDTQRAFDRDFESKWPAVPGALLEK